MTIIVYDRDSDQILVDRLYTFPPTSGLQSYCGSKVASNGRVSVTLAGSLFVGAVLEPLALEQLNAMDVKAEDGITTYRTSARLEVPGLPAGETCSGLGRNAQGRACSVEFGNGWLDIVEISSAWPFVHALGSGAEWFHAFRAIGHSTQEAFDMVCNHHAACGGGYTSF